MDTNRKGAIAEMKIATAATELGVPVLRPVVEHGRYDLGFEVGDQILRVQCKWGALDEAQALIKVALRTSWLTPAGYVRSPYLPSEIDLVAVYCGALDRCYLLPSSLACERTAIHLRLTPPRNKQRACINLASEFDFAGAVAQLEERRAGSAKARGSSPLSSTHSSTEVGCHQFPNHFGFYLERAAAGETVEISRRARPYARLVPVAVSEPLRAVGGGTAA
jgi:prevent-host-death family protein